MGKATNGNSLVSVEQCYIKPSTCGQITMQGLPEITDSKGATYNNEPIIGRSTPLSTYSHSDIRTINWEIPFYITVAGDIQQNLSSIFCLESLVYPIDGAGSGPPPTAQLKCGSLLERSGKEICAVLRNYSIRFASDVSWDDASQTYLPYKCVMSTTWEIVYPCDQLPQSTMIFSFGDEE
jgi:hypothetical protein